MFESLSLEIVFQTQRYLPGVTTPGLVRKAAGPGRGLEIAELYPGGFVTHLEHVGFFRRHQAIASTTFKYESDLVL